MSLIFPVFSVYEGAALSISFGSGLPSFPASGPLRLLAMASTAAIIALAMAALIDARRKKLKEASFSLAALILLLLSFALGRVAPRLHPIATAAEAGLLLHNLVFLRGSARALNLAAGILWVVAMFAARRIFSGES